MSLQYIVAAVVIIGAIVLPLSIFLGAVLLADFFGAKPFRWVSQARHFMNALDLADKRGMPYERALIKLADFGERDLGLHFHVLAEWLREGLKLHEALPLAPEFLPRPIQTLVIFGSKHGLLHKLIPIGQRSLQELTDRSANNRNEVFGLLTIAVALFGITWFLITTVMPMFAAVIDDMLPHQEVFFQQLVACQHVFLIGHAFVIAFMATAFFFMIGGAANHSYVENRLPRLADLLHRFFPWQRLRQEQRFGRMLTILLDQKVPEDLALQAAGAFAANSSFRRRIEGCVDDVRAGRGLIESLKRIGLDRDFQFRMRAAAESGRPFGEALSGWFDALHVRAQMRERAITDTASTLFTVYNAFIVGLVVYGFFDAEVRMINLINTW